MFLWVEVFRFLLVHLEGFGSFSKRKDACSSSCLLGEWSQVRLIQLGIMVWNPRVREGVEKSREVREFLKG